MTRCSIASRLPGSSSERGQAERHVEEVEQFIEDDKPVGGQGRTAGGDIDDEVGVFRRKKFGRPEDANDSGV